VQKSSMDWVHWQWSICSPSSSRRRWLPLSKKEGYKRWAIGGSWILSKEAAPAAPTIDKGWPPLLTKEQEKLSWMPINRGIR
jgi:hypothetical protein